jgi:hypothetical protein
MRAYTVQELAALEQEAAGCQRSLDDIIRQLGTSTYDIYINDRAYWRNVPANVWEYTIGGYRVVKKWLSYRERDVLGRDLINDEVREVASMMRRISALIILQPSLDANYESVSVEAYRWAAGRHRR